MAEETKKMKMPKKTATCVDLLYSTRQDRLRAKKVVDDLKSKEAQIAEHIISKLSKDDATGIAGKLARATIQVSEVPQAKDWEAFYKYIAENKRFDLLQKRLSGGAILDMQEDGITVPGIKNFTNKKVSLSKV